MKIPHYSSIAKLLYHYDVPWNRLIRASTRRKSFEAISSKSKTIWLTDLDRGGEELTQSDSSLVIKPLLISGFSRRWWFSGAIKIRKLPHVRTGRTLIMA